MYFHSPLTLLVLVPFCLLLSPAFVGMSSSMSFSYSCLMISSLSFSFTFLFALLRLLSSHRLSIDITWQSRVVFQTPGERSFHIFYNLLTGASPQEVEEWSLWSPDNYYYLNQGQCYQVSEE